MWQLGVSIRQVGPDYFLSLYNQNFLLGHLFETKPDSKTLSIWDETGSIQYFKMIYQN